MAVSIVRLSMKLESSSYIPFLVVSVWFFTRTRSVTFKLTPSIVNIGLSRSTSSVVATLTLFFAERFKLRDGSAHSIFPNELTLVSTYPVISVERFGTADDGTK